MQTIDFFTAVAREIKTLGYDLIIDDQKVVSGTRSVSLICLPSHRKINGTIGLLTIEAGDITNTAEVTGSSFDHAGPGVRRMSNRLLSAIEARSVLAQELTPGEYSPAQVAKAFAAAMEAAGYAA